MKGDQGLHATVSRFLTAWMGARQMIQAANFNRFQKAGLSATQFMTLNLIPVDGAKMTLGELARRMNLGAATVTKTLDSLETRGLLSRVRSDQDRREVLLTLTPEGLRLQNAASEEFHGYMAGLFRRLKVEQRTGLTEGLEALLGVSVEDGNAPRTEPKGDRARRGDPAAKRSSRRFPAG